MSPVRPEPLSAYRQELPYRELWPVARARSAHRTNFLGVFRFKGFYLSY